MLRSILASDDAYVVAEAFVQAGSTLEFATSRERGDPLESVLMADAQVLLGFSLPEFPKEDARPYHAFRVSMAGYRFLIASQPVAE